MNEPSEKRSQQLESVASRPGIAIPSPLPLEEMSRLRQLLAKAAIQVEPAGFEENRHRVERAWLRSELREELDRVLADDRVRALHRPATQGQEPKKPDDAKGSRTRGKRTPDIETSRRRVALYEQLTSELAKVQGWRTRNRRFRDLTALKREYPAFALWQQLSDKQQQELLIADLQAKGYAWNFCRSEL